VPPPDRQGPGARLLAWDARASDRLARTVESRSWRVAAVLLAHSGDSPLWLAVGTLALLLGGGPGRVLGTRILVATLMGGMVATLGKWIFRRNRPARPSGGLFLWVDRHAFPSGHATRAGCVVTLLAFALPTWAAGLLVVWAVLVALARVGLRLHYLTDVLAGLAAGCLTGLLIQAAL
jgi:undecaprenyl-diphosphatase